MLVTMLTMKLGKCFYYNLTVLVITDHTVKVSVPSIGIYMCPAYFPPII